jgi:hypothetical protein
MKPRFFPQTKQFEPQLSGPLYEHIPFSEEIDSADTGRCGRRANRARSGIGGRRGRRPAPNPEIARPHADGDRRDHRGGHLRNDRRGGLPRRPGRDLPVHVFSDRVRVLGLMLRGFRFAHPGGRFRLHLLVRQLRGAFRLDHRVGPDSRVRDREHRGRDLLERLFHAADVRLRSEDPGIPDDGLPQRFARVRRQSRGGPVGPFAGALARVACRDEGRRPCQHLRQAHDRRH